MVDVPEVEVFMAEDISAVRSILGFDKTDVEIVRALFAAGNNVERAINLLLDDPPLPNAASEDVKFNVKKEEPSPDDPKQNDAEDVKFNVKKEEPSPDDPKQNDAKSPDAVTFNVKKEELPEEKQIDLTEEDSGDNFEILTNTHFGKYLNPKPIRALPPPAVRKALQPLLPPSQLKEAELEDFPVEDDWFLLGKTYVTAQSTTKGSGKLEAGEVVYFKFPKEVSQEFLRKFGRKWVAARCGPNEIVRFWTKRFGEIGRLPPEWSRCLVPLVNASKVQIKGRSVVAPQQLSIMQDVLLYVSVYIHSSIFTLGETSWNICGKNQIDHMTHPLLTLFQFLKIIPSKKADFAVDELNSQKRLLDNRNAADDEPTGIVGLAKRQRGEMTYIEQGNEDQAISEAALNKLVGAAEYFDLEEAQPSLNLTCDLWPYQKQALYWMTELENGRDVQNARKSLHPFWSAYNVCDRRFPTVYVNVFTGEATTRFPSMNQMTRGGILADAMGLGKTVMTIALVLGKPREQINNREMTGGGNESSTIKGGTLIVCPMALLGQWKDEFDNHSEPGSISVFVHYGGARSDDARIIANKDVVLTTYGVLSQAYKTSSTKENIFHKIDWYRVVLDEAHTIKSSKSQVANAAFALRAQCRWCLTGTPLQNSLEDLYSLLCFLHVEPWCDYTWWHKLIQSPYERGDEKGLRLVKALLRPLMLRRTKDTKDKLGDPILVLPPVETEVVECKQSEAERDFYDALFRRSKVKFDEFVAQGRVLNNYASILEIILRLRQCCNHPFLVMSRADSTKYPDIDQLARCFIEGSSKNPTKSRPSVAYIVEVVEEIKRGELRECPICYESADDPVLTPCAHLMCRECLIGSWRTPAGGQCPMCRSSVTKDDLIPCPTGSSKFDPKSNWKSSCKVAKLVEMLESIKQSGSGEKSIVFSQWTSFLDLLEISLVNTKIGYLRFDGSLQQKQRERVLQEFREGNHKQVLLMSLKAGGVGLNLTAASNVFLMDPWWNPAVEEQAIMRIHRIGQKRKVHVRRFIVKGTVEERMVQVQVKKQRMITGALTDEEVRIARIEELKMLFR